MSAVLDLSLYGPLACPLVPLTLIIPSSLFISVVLMRCSSSGSIPVSDRSVNRKALSLPAESIMAFTWSVVGISGIGGWQSIFCF